VVLEVLDLEVGAALDAPRAHLHVLARAELPDAAEARAIEQRGVEVEELVDALLVELARDVVAL
jgi:hypothetical protein